jgi:hypothetical protein
LITSLVWSANEAYQWYQQRTHAQGKAKFLSGVIARWVQAFQRFDVVLEGVISHKAFFAG